MKKQTLLSLFPLFLSFFFFFDAASSLPNDTESLNRFRATTDVHGALRSSWIGPDACSASWRGVNCSSGGRVTALGLPSASLRGPVDALSALDQLRVLDLSDNRLNGTVSPLLSCTNLKLLYLAGNDLSGEIGPEIGSLRRLKRLDVSDNNIRGAIPAEIGRLTRLLTLRLGNNRISGKVPDLAVALSSLTELNLTNNELYGRVPYGLVKKFGGSSFSGNEALCGSDPLPDCAYEGSSPADPNQTVPSNPNDLPQKPILEGSKRPLSRGAIAAIAVAACVASVLVVSFAVANFCAAAKTSKPGGEGKVYGGGGGGGGGESDGTAATERSRLVFFERRKGFELEELLRASAEMLGKGSLGTVYRAALDGGSCVAVKRLRDANPCVRKEFEEYMDLIGRLKNRNVVRFRAYYYAKEEKLLVYDYLPNGSLHSLLHGNRGPGRIPLDWTTRISIVLGAARGLASVHEQYNAPKIPHGNIKSSNVLLDKNGVACVSDFGLSLLLNPAHAIARLGGYSAPEQAETKRLSHKADVYGFGVLLLEVLTGKSPSPARPRRVGEEEEGLDLPRWVRSVVKEEWTAEVFDEELLRYKNIEDELVAMLHVALACVALAPEKRPSMGEVVRMVEEIRVEDSPVGEEDYDESRDSLATTEDGLG